MDARFMRSRLAAILCPLVGLALVGAFGGPAPGQTALCDMPNMRGTAIYNRYCSPANAGNRAGPTQPTGPSPEEIAHRQRIAASREYNDRGIAAHPAGHGSD